MTQRNDVRQHRVLDEELGEHDDAGSGVRVLRRVAVQLSMGKTFAPGRAFRIPFTTTRSAGGKSAPNGAITARA